MKFGRRIKVGPGFLLHLLLTSCKRIFGRLDDDLQLI